MIVVRDLTCALMVSGRAPSYLLIPVTRLVINGAYAPCRHLGPGAIPRLSIPPMVPRNSINCMVT